MALLSSINFSGNEIISGSANNITLRNIKPHSLSKLKTTRYLYIVENKHFVPITNKEDVNKQWFSQLPVKVIHIEKIINVHDWILKK
jgi:hypothetical protein